MATHLWLSLSARLVHLPRGLTLPRETARKHPGPFGSGLTRRRFCAFLHRHRRVRSHTGRLQGRRVRERRGLVPVRVPRGTRAQPCYERVRRRERVQARRTGRVPGRLLREHGRLVLLHLQTGVRAGRGPQRMRR